MPGSLAIPAGLLYAFLLVLSRMLGIVVFVPLPVFQAAPATARIVLGVTATLCLFPRWPRVAADPGIGQVLGWILMEVLLGMAIGLAVAFLLEIFTFAAQAVSLQAGFGYASAVDPTTNADSTVLLLIAQTTAGLLFFAAGLDRELLKILAGSLESQPPGSLLITRSGAEALILTGAGIFSTGLRLALPLMTLLLVLDLSVGLLGRLNAQLQVSSLATPLKMIAALAVMSWSVLLFPRVFGQLSSLTIESLRRLLGG